MAGRFKDAGLRPWQLPHDPELIELVADYDRLKELVGDEPMPTWWQRFRWWLADFPGWWNEWA